MKVYTEVEQLSPEWWALKIGKFTGTDFTTVANGKKATIEKLCLKKAAEIITGKKQDESFTSHHIERGLELEAEARMKFELETGLEVIEVGFIELNRFCGVSPDGLVGSNAGVELKCKDLHTHLDFILNGDNSYKWQLQGSLFVTGYEKWYFASYNPDFPIEKQMKIYTITPEKEAFTMLEKGLKHCIGRVKDILEEYGHPLALEDNTPTPAEDQVIEEPEVDSNMVMIESMASLEDAKTVYDLIVNEKLGEEYQHACQNKVLALGYTFDKGTKTFKEKAE